MSRYDDDEDFDDDIDIRHRRRFHDERRHSGPGFVSVAMAILAGLGAATAAAIAALVELAQPPIQNDDELMVLAGLLLLGAGLLSFGGIVLGLGGTFQADRQPRFAVLGLALNGLVLLGILALACSVMGDM